MPRTKKAGVTNVISIHDFLLRLGAEQAARCARTQRVLAFVETLPPGTGPDEADARIREHIATFAN